MFFSPFCLEFIRIRQLDKQKEAMELAHVNYAQYSVYEIVRSFVSRILQTFNKEHH